MPSPVANSNADSPRSIRQTTPSLRFVANSSPLGSNAKPVGLVIFTGSSSTYPSGSIRNIVASSSWPREPERVVTIESSFGSTAGFATICRSSAILLPIMNENASPYLLSAAFEMDLSIFRRDALGNDRYQAG